MTLSNNNNIKAEDILRAMRDMLIEASPEEVAELAREAGFNSKQLSQASRRVVDQVTNQSNQGTTSENIILLHRGLSSLMVMLRRRDGLDEDELAQRANVDENEIRRIEYDPNYLPSPRTIYKLEQAFSLPGGVLAKLSGAIKHRSSELEERVQEFAANAKTIGKLTRAERDLLNAFVRFLAGKD